MQSFGKFHHEEAPGGPPASAPQALQRASADQRVGIHAMAISMNFMAMALAADNQLRGRGILSRLCSYAVGVASLIAIETDCGS
jgi:hypothetical protein